MIFGLILGHKGFFIGGLLGFFLGLYVAQVIYP